MSSLVSRLWSSVSKVLVIPPALPLVYKWLSRSNEALIHQVRVYLGGTSSNKRISNLHENRGTTLMTQTPGRTFAEVGPEVMDDAVSTVLAMGELHPGLIPGSLPPVRTLAHIAVPLRRQAHMLPKLPQGCAASVVSSHTSHSTSQRAIVQGHVYSPVLPNIDDFSVPLRVFV